MPDNPRNRGGDAKQGWLDEGEDFYWYRLCDLHLNPDSPCIDAAYKCPASDRPTTSQDGIAATGTPSLPTTRRLHRVHLAVDSPYCRC